MKRACNSFGFTAQAHAAEWVEALGLMKSERIEDHENDKELWVRHPYWQPRIDDRALAIIEGQMELLHELIRGRDGGNA